LMATIALQPGLNRVQTGGRFAFSIRYRSIAFLLFGKYPNRLSAWNSAGWPTLSPLLAKRGEVRVGSPLWSCVLSKNGLPDRLGGFRLDVLYRNLFAIASKTARKRKTRTPL